MAVFDHLLNIVDYKPKISSYFADDKLFTTIGIDPGSLVKIFQVISGWKLDREVG